jgi:hypothetical protein
MKKTRDDYGHDQENPFNMQYQNNHRSRPMTPGEKKAIREMTEKLMVTFLKNGGKIKKY